MGNHGGGSLFVGRKGPYQMLVGRLDEATGGSASVALVGGEPGIGKTRLLEEVASLAASRGCTVLRGGALDAEGMPPYLPFLEALGQYIRAAPVDLLRKETESIAATLMSILPELAARLGELPAGYPLPPEQAPLSPPL